MDESAGCEGKEKFTDLSIAQRAAGRRPGRNVYKCPICSHYHVGSHRKTAMDKFKRPAPRRLGR